MYNVDCHDLQGLIIAISFDTINNNIDGYVIHYKQSVQACSREGAFVVATDINMEKLKELQKECPGMRPLLHAFFFFFFSHNHFFFACPFRH